MNSNEGKFCGCCEHNTLYKSVKINHELINQWTESFIPPVLQEAVVNLPEARNSDERGTYAGDMEGFSENDLHNALDDIADGTIARSGAVYSDVEGQRQNPELKMIIALMEMINKPGECTSDADAQEAVEIPVITWVGDGRHVLMNDYEHVSLSRSNSQIRPYARPWNARARTGLGQLGPPLSWSGI